MKAVGKRFDDNIAALLLFLPLAMHWLLPEGPKWEQAFTTISLEGIKYSWVVIFYIIYYLRYSKYSIDKKSRVVIKVFVFAFVISPLALLFVEDGSYAIELFFSAIPFYLVPVILLSKPLQERNFHILKYPLFFIFLISIYSYGTVAISLLSSGYGDVRPSTMVGSINISSYFLVVMACLLSELYFKKEDKKILLLLFTMAFVLIGACRGAVLLLGLYIFILIIKTFKRTKTYLRVIVVALIAGSIYYAYTSNLFAFISARNDDIENAVNFDLTTGRSDRITYVLDKAFKESPVIGVGHGRVFPSSKDLLELRDDHNFHYSKFEGAPHNIYVLALVEYGIFGVILLVIGLTSLLKILDFRKMTSYLVLLMLFVLGNVEAILIQDDLWPLFWIVVGLSAKPRTQNMLILRK